MRPSVRKYIILFLIICVLLFLGYYRDFIFVTVNALIQARYYEANYTLPASLKFLDNLETNSLINLKWILTFLVSFVYLAIALFTIKTVFNNRKYSMITIGLYFLIFIISGSFMVAGVAFEGIAGKMYAFARYLMGMAQSPLILMILIPAFKLSEQEHTNIAN